jgi:hypothetical protein
MSTQTIWGIHAGKTGDAHSLFLNRNVVAVGWTAMGDLSAIPSNRDAFKAAVAKTYPTAKPGAIPNNAGQLFRFVHEMKQGDLVVYPSKSDRRRLGHAPGAAFLLLLPEFDRPGTSSKFDVTDRSRHLVVNNGVP